MVLLFGGAEIYYLRLYSTLFQAFDSDEMQKDWSVRKKNGISLK